MGPRGTRPAPAALLVLLTALATESRNGHLFIDPRDNVVLPYGGSLLVNCSTTCEQSSVLGLETYLNKEEVARGEKWRLFKLSDVEENSQVMCHTYCNGTQEMASTSLTIYRLPERVELAPLPHWQRVGENLTLSCQVVGGAPRANLTIVLLRGEEELSRQPAEGDPAEVTITVPARREDHGANYSCRTELDLRGQGLELFKTNSTSKQLRTFVLPVTRPLLSAPRILEVGSKLEVACSLNDVFPVWEAGVYLALGDNRLSPVIVRNTSALQAKAWVTADTDEEGTQPLTCAVILGNQSWATRSTVTIYSFPAPNVTQSPLEVSEQTKVTVVCEAHPEAVVTLTGSPALTPTPTKSTESRVQFELTASAEDNGRRFFCSAALRVEGQILHKNQSKNLSVLYGPRLDERDCPGNWTWEKGSEQTLKCQAWGNPPPTLHCHRKEDNFPLPIGELRPVKPEHAGSYLCRAVSKRGEVTRQVVVNVLYHQNSLAIIMTVTAAVILSAAGVAAYVYNRQRKIRKYKLQKAQEAASMKKMNTPPTPP